MDKLTRRDVTKLTGLGAGTLMASGALSLSALAAVRRKAVPSDSSTTFDPTILKHITESFYIPGEQLDQGEIRITFMGTNYIPRIGQACNSVFIECGNGESFVFDCGSGVCAKYVSLGVPWSRMTQVFLTHLHADHMTDLVYIYCFGPSGDRFTALHVYGPSGPILPKPYPNGPLAPHPEEGTEEFCKFVRKMTKWHRESFSFLPTGITEPTPQDGYDLVPHELPYMVVGGPAYPPPGVSSPVTVTHFPAAHDRDGAISFKLNYNGMNIVFSGDTRPNTFLTQQSAGADVLIHEMALDADVWAQKNGAVNPGDSNYNQSVQVAQTIIDNSHTPASMFGKILSLTKPRLGVITHCQFNEDTFIHALDEVRAAYPTGDLVWAVDAMVLNVTPTEIRQRMGLFSDFAWNMNAKANTAPSKPKYSAAQWSDYIRNSIITS
jgi:ribonuclease Z